MTQESINAIRDPALIKDLCGVAIACNQAYLDFRKIKSENLLGHTAYEIFSQAQADLHTLADEYLLKSESSEFEYEGYKESGKIKITISRAKYFGVESDVILVILKPEIVLSAPLGPKIHLTIREHSILQLLIQGNSHKRMAQLLNLSQHTIAGYVKAIYIKLGVQSSTQAILIATTKLGMRAKT